MIKLVKRDNSVELSLLVYTSNLYILVVFLDLDSYSIKPIWR
jgi:hypothetical protein